MISSERIQAIMAGYVQKVDAGDIEAIVALYAEDAVVEDPVGQPALRGLAAIGDFYRQGLGQIKVAATLTGPVRATLNGCGAMAFRVDMLWQGEPCSLQVIDVMEFDEQGLIRSMKAYWGPVNIQPQG
ncbi:steroid delta-isomerase [Pseudomonas sp. NFPP10]|uniref:steroid Delta-isomerase n=1 Tax=Pseudomonas TaxID=286 RepID=UPI00087F20D8|nr:MULTISPECIES: steroid Delta-isomerase [Pseudomonas]MCU1766001.1 nuclear transport factor 2 family protein [Pseudomonas protegens]ROL79126.1 steroid delta-isomerase [Pseudomonas protegens]SDA34796.1 steroid delta-isomerase [Pseudomonas sp. NFPP12]SEM66876.1 steroid delta-isomerase [Pseudomonas sp. NFPP10]SFK28024.1 steroid delta-isomerase [Pseudomonas sp. NFPP08]